MTLTPYLKQIQSGQNLSREDMITAMRAIMEGKVSDIQLSAFLYGLSVKGETVEEITGAASVMREKALPIKAPNNAIDCCGTGGDASGTYNISTAVALVCAAQGVPMAKHGNRSASSKSGAADVLESLGYNLEASIETLEKSLIENNFAFLMAPKHHSAMKHVVPVRKGLGVRTIFNILGPLANPANTKRQLMGVFSSDYLRPIAETLNNLGTEKAWIVYGTFGEQGGVDEISTTGETQICILDHGKIEERTIRPADFGLETANPESLKGGCSEVNAKALKAILEGENNAYSDVVIANAAAVLMIADKATDLKESAAIARETIQSGKALETLKAIIETSHS